MDLPAAQRLLGKEGRVDQVDVLLRPGADVATVQRAPRGRAAVLAVGASGRRCAASGSSA